MTRFLLDSHVFLWWISTDPRLSDRAVETVRRAADVQVSVASIWELSIKIAKGKLDGGRNLIAAAEEFQFRLLPIQAEHAEAAARMPYVHRAPFDHMLLAQAKVEGLTLVTHDDALLHYGVSILLV